MSAGGDALARAGGDDAGDGVLLRGGYPQLVLGLDGDLVGDGGAPVGLVRWQPGRGVRRRPSGVDPLVKVIVVPEYGSRRILVGITWQRPGFLYVLRVRSRCRISSRVEQPS